MPRAAEIGISNIIQVAIADLAVSADPDVLLSTSPLGAGLGVAIYDPIVKVGGLLHSILPSSSLDRQRAYSHPGMFLDTGLQTLFARARELHASQENYQIYIAGAGQILDQPPELNIGRANCENLAMLLPQLGLEICAQEVGRRTDCSMELVLATGEVRLKFCGQREHSTLCRP